MYTNYYIDIYNKTIFGNPLNGGLKLLNDVTTSAR